jgi:hypothetical protein
MKNLTRKIGIGFGILGSLFVGAGALATATGGFEGKLRVRPGQMNNVVQLEQLELTVTDERGNARRLPSDWAVDRVLPDKEYEASRLYYPAQTIANAQAVHLSSRLDPRSGVWVEAGVPARLLLSGASLYLYYGPKEVVLPFSVSKAEAWSEGGYEAKPVQSARELLDRTPASERHHVSEALSRGIGPTSLLEVRYDPGRGLRLLGAWIVALSLVYGLAFRLYSARAGGSLQTH